jgi:hypothetical protein|nr:DciA family protein [Halothiobacillus sp.]
MKPGQYDALKPIAKRAGLIRMFDLFLQESLPRELIGRIRVLNLRDSILVLGVDHAALATQVRFQARGWLPRLNAAASKQGNLPTLIGVEVRIATDIPRPKIQRTGQEPDAQTRHALLNMANEESDPGLAQALRRLADVQLKGRRRLLSTPDATD